MDVKGYKMRNRQRGLRKRETSRRMPHETAILLDYAMFTEYDVIYGKFGAMLSVRDRKRILRTKELIQERIKRNKNIHVSIMKEYTKALKRIEKLENAQRT